MKKNIVCYTYISNNYDALESHTYTPKDWDYVCFTNNEQLIKQRRVGVWVVKKSQFEKLDPKRNSGWHKTHPHVLFPEYERSVWIDSNIDVLTDFLEKKLNSTTKKMLVPLHFERDCIYDEVQEVKVTNHDTPEKCDATYNFLVAEKMPKKYGLNETNIMLRWHNLDKIKSLDEMWWDCIKKYSRRDQLSFSYCLFKHNIKVQDISFPNARIDEKNYKIIAHNYPKKPEKFKIFRKERLPHGHRKIYFCGIKIFSYHKKPAVSVSMFRPDIIKYKAFMYSNNIQTIILGSSHGRDGFIPDNTSFNLANSSQDLYRAYKVYEYITKQPEKCSALKNVILFWSVFHPGLQLEKTQEYMKCIPYKVFYDAPYAVAFPIDDKPYVKQLKKLYAKTSIPDDYRGKSLWNINHEDITAELVEKHLKNTKRNNNQIQYVEKMLELAQKYNHNLYIVLPPYRGDYLGCLPPADEVHFELFDFLAKHHDVKLLDFQYDGDFKDNDFDSADHCNERGATKLTKKIKKYLR